MNTFRESIPPDLLAIPNVSRLTNVLDRMLQDKNAELYKFDTAQNPAHIRDRNYLQRYLYEFGQLQAFKGAPHFIIERLIFNAYDIFALKGSHDGLKLFIHSACDGDVVSDYSEYDTPPYIIPSSITGYGTLPNGNDLKYPGGVIGFLPGGSPCYLFGGSFAAYYSTVKIGIVSPYVGNAVFRDFLSRILPEYLPMVHPYTTQLTINYYNTAMIPVGNYHSIIT
jgi:hypothetical protein